MFNGEARSELFGIDSFDPDGHIVSFKWKLINGQSTANIENDDKDITKIQFSKEGEYIIELTVTDNDGATDSMQVLVSVRGTDNQPPKPKAAAIPSELTLSANNAAVADLDGNGSVDPDGTIVSFVWSMTKGPAGGADIKNKDKIFTTVEFSKPGEYEFMLTATDNKGATGLAFAAIKVTAQEPTITKTCAPVKDIITSFNKLSSADTAANFKAFGTQYILLREITAFYKLMETTGAATQPVKDQVKFFIDQKIETRLVTWINELKGLIQENSNLRLLAMLMFNLHAELSYYISCIQKDDVDNAEVKMMKTLRAVAAVLQAVKPSVPNFPAAHKKLLTQLAEIVKAEMKRVKNNNEETIKINYVKSLKTILDQLN
jgi:hypothetical protein